MASKNFYLKEANQKGLSLILFVYQDKGQKFRFSTKILVDKNQWDGAKIKGSSIDVFAKNKKLREYSDIIEDIEIEAIQSKQSFAIDVIERKFKKRLEVDQKETTFFSLYEDFVQSNISTKAYKTIQCYKATKRKLLEYSSVKHIEITFEIINRAFYNSFLNYLIADLGLLNNTAGRYIKDLKVFLNYLKNNELINTNINTSGFKVFKEDIDIIALTEKELFLLYNFDDLPAHLLSVKDLFCFSCFTGLRYSDVSRIKHEHIKENFIELKTQKTRDYLTIPLNVFSRAIISKYEGSSTISPLPPALSNQKMNAALKEIVKTAGIVEQMVVEKYSGSRKIILQNPKYEFVSTHTGRKTFITISHERGMPIEMIMKITGIKKWDTLKKYLKVSEKSKLLKMNEFWSN